MQGYAQRFYRSTAWEACRRSYIAERQAADGGMCEQCHERPGFIVHHKEPITPANINDPDVTLSWENLQFVCKRCHDRLHEYCGRQRFKPRCRFEENGNVLPINDNQQGDED